jgi:CRISPR-associated protein Cmr1
VDTFPRAAFGLPIVLHFNTFTDPGDPEDHVLEPADISADDKRDRMASPLILGPYWNGTRWQPAALLVPGWEGCVSQPLKLKNKTYVPQPWPTDAKGRSRLAKEVPPLRGRGDDPLTAFLRFFEEA